MSKLTSIVLGRLGFIGICGFLALSSAHADVVVRPGQVKYGALIIAGEPNATGYRRADTYSITMNSVGSKSQDSGSVSDYQELNKPVKLRVGQYTVVYSNSTMQVDITDGKTTKVQLRKITAAPMDGTTEVSIYNTDLNYEYLDDELVATWYRTSQEVSGKKCHYVYPLLQLPREVCDNTYETVSHKWSTATFSVLPGTYSMIWTLKDGTTHQEDSIVVK